MIVVVDASVVVKWLVEEPDSAAAMRWLRSQHLLVAPAHAFGEIGEVLCRHVREEAIGRSQAAGAFAFVRRYVSMMPLPDLLEKAADLAIGTGAAFYDALYVALAERYGTFVVTADRKLMRLVAGSEWQNRVVDLMTQPPPP